jgi:hypothetical protein
VCLGAALDSATTQTHHASSQLTIAIAFQLSHVESFAQQPADSIAAEQGTPPHCQCLEVQSTGIDSKSIMTLSRLPCTSNIAPHSQNGQRLLLLWITFRSKVVAAECVALTALPAENVIHVTGHGSWTVQVCLVFKVVHCQFCHSWLLSSLAEYAILTIAATVSHLHQPEIH